MHIEKIEAIAAQSAANLKALFGELSEEINTAILAATEQAQTEDKESVKVTLAHSIEIDLTRDTQKDSLAVSVRHKVSLGNMLPDPNQSLLPL